MRRGIQLQRRSTPSENACRYKVVPLSLSLYCTTVQDLPLRKGEKVVIIGICKNLKWYKARKENGSEGLIPYNYVQKVATPTAIELNAAGAEGKTSSHDNEKQAVLLKSMP